LLLVDIFKDTFKPGRREKNIESAGGRAHDTPAGMVWKGEIRLLPPDCVVRPNHSAQ